MRNAAVEKLEMRLVKFSHALVELLRSVGVSVSKVNEIRLSQASFRPNIALEMVLECFKNVTTVNLVPSH
ncbi:hypothetical protein AAVH_17684 [Aphelenchoides avenae]|nr:hypothetical protein AAVH_17684 [Aphelenchus avenae]